MVTKMESGTFQSDMDSLWIDHCHERQNSTYDIIVADSHQYMIQAKEKEKYALDSIQRIWQLDQSGRIIEIHQ